MNHTADLFDWIHTQMILSACACRQAGLMDKRDHYHRLAQGAAQIRVALLGL
jgi:hypothetical protein